MNRPASNYQHDENERALAALWSLNPDCLYDKWIRIGMACRAAGLDLADWNAWSAKGATYPGPRDLEMRWKSFKPGGGISAGTLFHFARGEGWQDQDGSRVPVAPRKFKHDPHDFWDNAPPPPADHPYIAAKGGTPDGLRVVNSPLEGWGPHRGRNLQGWLMVPAWGLGGKLASLQLIGPSGGSDKLNLIGCPMEGNVTVGTLTPGQTAYAVEGIGHAWSIQAVTGCAAVVSFGSAGLERAARSILDAGGRPVLVADRGTEAKTEAAATSAGCPWVALPADLPNGADINDLHTERGQDAALAALQAERDPKPHQQGDDALASGSQFFPASDLDGLPVPDRHWLVEGLVPSGTVTLLGGDGGTGKSLLSLQLACAAALGRHWIGLPVSAGPALFISAEDDLNELHRRIVEVSRAEGVTPADLGRLTVRSLAGEDALLAKLEGRTGAIIGSPLYTELDRRIAALRPVVVILDTLADYFPGNENDRAQARQFIGMLRRLAIHHECAVVMLAHPSLSGLNSGAGTSGSTGWNNSVRARLYLSRVVQDGYEPNPDARVLRTMKANYGPTGGEIALTWHKGVFVADAPMTGLDRMAATAKAERVFLKLLHEFSAQGRRVNHAGGPTYAPKMFAENPGSEGCTKKALKLAMDALLASRKIRIAEDGPTSKRRSFLTLADTSNPKAEAG
jgi:RecA-family ATPase